MLLYFILGILFISLAIPILEALSSIVTAWSEYIVYLFAFKVYHIKLQMSDKEDEEEEQVRVIGFTEAVGEEIPVPEEQEE